MREVTDFGKKEILMTFDMLDWMGSGEIGFQQFYMLVCILMSSHVRIHTHTHAFAYTHTHIQTQTH